MNICFGWSRVDVVLSFLVFHSTAAFLHLIQQLFFKVLVLSHFYYLI